MPIVLRAVKGSRLTIAELDGNFTFLQGEIEDIIASPPSARSIESVEQVGNSLVIHYDDSTEDGPFPLGDIQLTFRGEWTTDTVYLKFEILTYNGTVYMVGVTHTSSPTEFDPDATDGFANNLYNLLLEFPGNALPTGGLTDAVLTKLSDDNFDMGWRARGVPPDGEIGDTLVKLSADEGDYRWQARGSLIAKPIGTISDATFNADLPSYANIYFRCTNEAGCHFRIPALAEVELSIGDEFEVRQCSAGRVEFDPDDGVTLNTISGFGPVTAVEGAVMVAKLVGVDVWDVWGYLGTLSSDSDTDVSF